MLIYQLEGGSAQDLLIVIRDRIRRIESNASRSILWCTNWLYHCRCQICLYERNSCLNNINTADPQDILTDTDQKVFIETGLDWLWWHKLQDIYSRYTTLPHIWPNLFYLTWEISWPNTLLRQKYIPTERYWPCCWCIKRKRCKDQHRTKSSRGLYT